jgi:hypothetical protein
MSDNQLNMFVKNASAQSSESDDFILPIAPPAFSLIPNRSSVKKAPDSGLSNKIASEAYFPSTSISSEVTQDGPLTHHESSEWEKVDASEESSEATVSTNIGRAKSNSLVVWLFIAVGVLFFGIIIQYNLISMQLPSPMVSLPSNDKELSTEREKTKFALHEAAIAESKIRNLEDQLIGSQRLAEGKYASLLEENEIFKKKCSQLSDEIALLRNQAENTSNSERIRVSTVQKNDDPDSKNARFIYIAGVPEGDTLTVRSGPGSHFISIATIRNGHKVEVTGENVINGFDTWIPCIVEGKIINSQSGKKESFRETGWINSRYVK